MYVVRRGPALTSRDVRLDTIRAELDPQTSLPSVVMQFTGRGKRVFEAITRREAHAGAQGADGCRNVLRNARHFAIAVDRQLLSIPYVDYCAFPKGISADNGIQIQLSSMREAELLALELRSGVLPVRFVRVR